MVMKLKNGRATTNVHVVRKFFPGSMRAVATCTGLPILFKK